MTATNGDADRVRFDPEDGTRIRLDEAFDLSGLDVETLEALRILDVEHEERDGKIVATECTIDLQHLGLLAAEIDTSERRLGDRFPHRRWRPDIRLRL